MQAAIGLQQLGKLPQWLAARRRNAAILESALADLHNVRLAVPPEGVDHSYYKYYAFIETAGLAPGWTRDRVVAEINAAGAPCFTGPCPEIYRRSEGRRVGKELGNKFRVRWA